MNADLYVPQSVNFVILIVFFEYCRYWLIVLKHELPMKDLKETADQKTKDTNLPLPPKPSTKPHNQTTTKIPQVHPQATTDRPFSP